LSEGYTPLRETLKVHLLKTQGIDFKNNEVFIVSGGQQAADLTAKVLLNEGDVVITEDPSFIGCLNTFRSYNAKLVGVPMQPDGMDIDALKKALSQNPKAKMIYTIPSFQNPTGFTTSAQKRKAIYELARQYDVVIFEDNPYGEIRFSGEDIPCIKSLDADGRVIYAGSFSKTMAPAFRLGFLVFDSALTSRITVAKQCTDVHSTLLFQFICNEYMTRYDYDGHINLTRALYRKKSTLMLDEMERCFHPSVRFNRPDGGLFVMAFLPEGNDSFPFVQESIKRKVACVPGVAFSVDQSCPSTGFRMNYSTPSEENIKKGIEILGGLTHEWISK
jgi:2-aminoadipate transaminase